MMPDTSVTFPQYGRSSQHQPPEKLRFSLLNRDGKSALHLCMPTFMLEKLDLPFDKRLAVNKAAELFNVEYSFAEERLALWEIQMMGIMYVKSPSLL
ncbi:hypothetical protein RG959_22360 [Domibacillus sp. 8LH]|uniref:hypothetical protein n=1 Tax=Domibacillus sp. 8LH TaxID=3073900 RepID=UPI0031774A08